MKKYRVTISKASYRIPSDTPSLFCNVTKGNKICNVYSFWISRS